MENLEKKYNEIYNAIYNTCDNEQLVNMKPFALLVDCITEFDEKTIEEIEELLDDNVVDGFYNKIWMIAVKLDNLNRAKFFAQYPDRDLLIHFN